MRKLAVFAKRPEPGRVKTRLSPVLSPDLACDLHRALLEDTLTAVAACPADQRLLYWAEAPASRDPAPPPEPGAAETAGAAGFEPRIQRGADLGARLERAFEELLLEPGDRAVILGSDCPTLDAAALEAALEALERAPLVLGPTRDGGYYLVGLARRAPELFRGVAWSTARVLEQTLARAQELRLEHITLTEREDLDTPEDLVRWLRRSAAEPGDRLRVNRALRVMGLLPGEP